MKKRSIMILDRNIFTFYCSRRLRSCGKSKNIRVGSSSCVVTRLDTKFVLSPFSKFVYLVRGCGTVEYCYKAEM